MLPSLAIILASVLAVARARLGAALGGYNLAQTSQYHIQTDEGPERYFRYQTDSGQYRKEKRLEDGTVVGTYGWVDAAGYLRLRDYVADTNGYRIVRTKKLWVGDEPIGRAVASAKYTPGQGGVGVANALIPNPTPSPLDTPDTVYVTPPSPFAVRVSPAAAYLPPASSTPRPYFPAPTPAPGYSSTPRPYFPSSTSRPYFPAASSSAKPFVVVSSTPSPSYSSSSASPSAFADATPSPIRGDEATAYSSPSSPLRAPSRHGGGHLYDHAPPPRRGYISELPGSYDASSNSLIPEYDGIAVTHNGFRYYLPRHYHEEENIGRSGDRRSGSFGYIDPFGIRRVVYYNTSPGSGFNVRKNNRYVGFNATPYDPRI